MDNKAISIALLLPASLNQLCIELNHSIPNNSYIRFSDTGPWPHISLYQTILSTDEIDQVHNFLLTIKKEKYLLEKLWINNFTSVSGSKVSYLEFESNAIHILHEKMMKFCGGFEKRIATQEHHLHSTDVSEGQLTYITNFEDDHAYDKYNPHITLGREHIDYKQNIPDFSCTEIGIFHLGPNGTCQKRL